MWNNIFKMWIFNMIIYALYYLVENQTTDVRIKHIDILYYCLIKVMFDKSNKLLKIENKFVLIDTFIKML